jgi:carboxymethylenebutenolidase
MSEVQINAQDGSGTFMAYVALPEKTPAPAVILIQEIFGVNQEMRDKCEELARQGFIAICPDLFWRMEPGVQLTDKTEQEWARAFEFFNNFDVACGIDDLQATEAFIRNHPQSSGKIGCAGYCLGGKLAYLMATRTTIDASVGYYAVGLDELLDEQKNIKNPLLLHIAEEDKFVTKEQQEIIKEGLSNNPLIKIHSYPGVNHAFARGQGEHYDEQAAMLANQRTLEFLKNNLDLAMAA